MPDQSIPKILHYCWFGGKEKPEGVVKCIESWKKVCPDYEIVEWNEENFQVDALPYTKEAYEAKKWAFVSDVARLKALVKHGGIYLDTDVELIKPFDEVLCNEAFVGFEGTKFIATAVMGCRPGNLIMSEFLDMYRNAHFANGESDLDFTTNVTRLTDLLVEKGMQLNGCLQKIGDMTIYPTDYFSPYDYIDGRLKTTKNTIAIHWYSVSWLGNMPLRRRLSQIYHRIIGKHRE